MVRFSLRYQEQTKHLRSGIRPVFNVTEAPDVTRWGLGISAGAPGTNLLPLAKKEVGTRQFRYPTLQVPEPGNLAPLGLARRKR
jgi:hypothetical protein